MPTRTSFHIFSDDASIDLVSRTSFQIFSDVAYE